MALMWGEQLVPRARNYCTDNDAGQIGNPKRPVHQPFGAQYHAVMSFPVTVRRRMMMMMMLRQPKFLGKFPFTCQGKPVGESGRG